MTGGTDSGAGKGMGGGVGSSSDVESCASFALSSASASHPASISAREQGSAYSRHHRTESRARSLPLSYPLDADDLQPKAHKLRIMSPKDVGRAIGARLVRAAKRGNLPFMLVFTM